MNFTIRHSLFEERFNPIGKVDGILFRRENAGLECTPGCPSFPSALRQALFFVLEGTKKTNLTGDCNPVNSDGYPSIEQTAHLRELPLTDPGVQLSAIGSLRGLFAGESVQADPILSRQERVVLQQFVEGVPRAALPFPSTIKHPDERFHHLIVKSALPRDVVSYTAVLVITSQGSVRFVSNDFRTCIFYILAVRL